jgi:hypothetical protein
MKIDTWACDVCGMQKKETNHWFLILPVFKEGKSFTIAPWDNENATVSSVLHVCGEACVQKKVAELLVSITR